jgi:hypothetical protein
MSNSWSHELVLRPAGGSAQLVADALEVMYAHGFDVANSSGTVTAFPARGTDFVFLREPAAAPTWLAERRGALVLWHGASRSVDVSLTLNDPPRGAGLARLGIAVDAIHFRPAGAREPLAAMMRNAFMDLVATLGPPYGYVVDEEILETLSDMVARMAAIEPAVAGSLPPPDVFWLNYFSDRYATAIGLDRLQRLGLGLRAEAGGYVIQLTDYPWQLTQAHLRDVRRRWNEIFGGDD